MTECETCDEGVFMYVVPTLLFRYGRNKRADLFLLHSITDDVGNAWQTPQSDDQDPQVRLQYLLRFFFFFRIGFRCERNMLTHFAFYRRSSSSIWSSRSSTLPSTLPMRSSSSPPSTMSTRGKHQHTFWS